VIYRVLWSVEVEAESGKQAAELAQEVMNKSHENPQRQFMVFKVTPHSNDYLNRAGVKNIGDVQHVTLP